VSPFYDLETYFLAHVKFLSKLFEPIVILLCASKELPVVEILSLTPAACYQVNNILEFLFPVQEARRPT
jgi:hypothetical protein